MQPARALTVGITGDQGFLGWHLRCRLHPEKDVQVRGAGRALLADATALDAFVAGADAIVHLAGMNRGEEAEIEQVNLQLTGALIAACERAHARPHVIFANSTHGDRDTAYGRSKRRSAELLSAWARRVDAKFTNLIMPNVFGEGGRPHYNSAVATFCHQLAVGEAPRIIEDREIEIVHAQEAATRILACVRAGTVGDVTLSGRRIKVSALLARLQDMAREYRGHVIPALTDVLDLALFNTLRSYLFPKYYPVSAELRTDARGALFEAVKTLHGGQCFLSMTKPGITRGNHYHTAKIERFMVVRGSARIRVRRLFSHDVAEFMVSGDTPQYIDMPTFHTHDITNVGRDELMTLFWAHEIFDPQRPDTIPEPV